MNIVKNKNYESKRNTYLKYYATSSLIKQASKNKHQDYIVTNTGKKPLYQQVNNQLKTNTSLKYLKNIKNKLYFFKKR